MRSFLLELLEDLIFDASLIDFIQDGPPLSWAELADTLLMALLWAAAGRIAARGLWAIAKRLVPWQWMQSVRLSAQAPAGP